MRYAEWVSAVLEATARTSSPGRPAGFARLAEELAIDSGEVTWEKASQEGTAGHALTNALTDLADLGYVEFEAVVNGAAITQAGRDAVERGLRHTWAAWWDDTHLNPRSAGLLARLTAYSESPGSAWVDVLKVDCGDIWRADGPPLEPEDLDEWQQLRDVTGELHGKGLVKAWMFGRDSITARPTWKGVVRAMEDHPMSAARRAGVLDWMGPRPGWEADEQQLDGLIEDLANASDPEALKNVGRRARDLYDRVAAKMFDPSMVPAGTDQPGPNDGKRMLEFYVNARLAGSSNKELRDFTKALDALANNLTHSTSIGRVKAFGSVQAMVLLVRLLQEIEASDE